MKEESGGKVIFLLLWKEQVSFVGGGKKMDCVCIENALPSVLNGLEGK